MNDLLTDWLCAPAGRGGGSVHSHTHASPLHSVSPGVCACNRQFHRRNSEASRSDSLLSIKRENDSSQNTLTSSSILQLVLCSPYRTHVSFWHFIVILHVLAMSVTRTFILDATTQSLAFVMFCVLAWILQLYISPFKRSLVNTCQSIFLLCLTCFVMLNLPLASLRSSSVATDRFPTSLHHSLSAIQGIVLCVPLCVALSIYVHARVCPNTCATNSISTHNDDMSHEKAEADSSHTNTHSAAHYVKMEPLN
jgi:hypothetical protein